MKKFICHCFKYTREDIEKDITQNGHSTIIKSIRAEKSLGGCDCANRNPKGR